MTDHPRHPVVRVAPHHQAKAKRPAITDIIVMVAGTVSPVNLKQERVARSYADPHAGHDPTKTPDKNDPSFYWVDSVDLRDNLTTVKLLHPGATIFDLHGWSGDNAIANRHVAGDYLARRFCSRTKSVASLKEPDQVPFYEALLKSKVSFHLVGHSHGGNVINEFTKTAATFAEWPATWKIKSVVYLSTPFFQRLHQVNVSKFDASAKVLSVYNEYDLTQRIVADFSMKHLPDVIELAKTHELEMNSAIGAILDGSTGLYWKLANPRHIKLWRSIVEGRPMLEEDVGVDVYSHSRAIAVAIRALIDIGSKMIDSLHRKQPVVIARELRSLVPTERQVMSDALAQKFRDALAPLYADIDAVIAGFDAKLKSRVFPQDEYFDDWHAETFLASLVKLIAVDPATLQGPLLDLIADLLAGDMDQFDNTTNKVDHQLRGTPFASTLEAVNISTMDPFDGHAAQREIFKQAYVKRLEACEDRFSFPPTRHQVWDLLFTLAGQPRAEWFDRLLRWDAEVWKLIPIANGGVLFPELLPSTRQDPAKHPFNALFQTIHDYITVLEARRCGDMVVDKIVRDTTVGTVEYFAKTAHSLSHVGDVKRVREFLSGQMTKPAASGAKP